MDNFEKLILASIIVIVLALGWGIYASAHDGVKCIKTESYTCMMYNAATKTMLPQVCTRCVQTALAPEELE